MSLKLYQHSVNHPRALSWEQCITFLGAMYYFLGSNSSEGQGVGCKANEGLQSNTVAIH